MPRLPPVTSATLPSTENRFFMLPIGGARYTRQAKDAILRAPPLMSSHAPLPTLRWLGPLALLLAEYLWVTLQFDALPLLHSSGLSGEFGHLGIAAPLFAVVATVGYVLAGEREKRELARAALEPARAWQVAALIALNLACYAGLLGLTAAAL